jgi:hypothetical protein
LYLKGTFPLLAFLRERVEDRVTPRDVGLIEAPEMAEQPNGRRVRQRIGRIRVIHVRAHEVWLEHAVDRDQTIDHRLEVPHVLAELHEVVGRRATFPPARLQLLEPLSQHARGLGVIEDVIAERRLERELRRRLRPPGDHLHQLLLEEAIVRETLRVLDHREPAPEIPAVDYGHLRSPPSARQDRAAQPNRAERLLA